MATDNELESLFGQAPNDLGFKIQQGLQDAWKKNVLEERETNFIEPLDYWILFYMHEHVPKKDEELVAFLVILFLVSQFVFEPYWTLVIVIFTCIISYFIRYLGKTLLNKRKQMIINSKITSLPTADFVFNFARDNGIKIIDNHIQTFQDNSSKLRNHRFKLESDLREAQRLYAGDLNTSEYLTIQKILHSKMTKIDQEVERIPLFIKRLEDFKDEVYRRTKMIMAKQERLAFFEKISKDNTEEMVVEMKTQQQLTVQELEESFTVLLSMMNDAQHYIDAKQEVEHKMLD